MRKWIPAVAIGALAFSWTLQPDLGLAHVTTTNTVVFEREIIGILERHCVACHAPEGPASSLVTYEETWLRRGPILASILRGDMPPWGAVHGYGSFANDNGLTPTERQFVVSWVEGLGPRNGGEQFLNVTGGAQAREPLQARADTSEWALGEPDLTVSLPPRTVVPGNGLRSERLVLDPDLSSEQGLRALEFRPGSRRMVRAASFFLEESGEWIGSWTPWYGFVTLPEPVAHRLTPGARITAEIRYGSASEGSVAEGALGLFFAHGSDAEPIDPFEVILAARGEVPGSATGRRLRAESRIDREIRVLALVPELDRSVRSIEVSARRPDGGTEILLFAKDVPPDWPTPYVMSEPIRLPASSVLRATAYFENSSEIPLSGGFRVRVSVY